MLLRNPFTRDARVLREARSLASSGHEVTVIAIRTGDLPESEDKDGFRIERAVEGKSWMGPTILGSPAEEGVGGGAMASVRMGTLGQRSFRPPAAVIARDIGLERVFRKAAARFRADIIHAHDLNTLGPAMAVAEAKGIPVVYDAHELYVDLTGLSSIERRRWRSIEEKLIRKTAAVIAPTKARAEVLAERYDIDLPVVVMNCPDPSSEGLTDNRLDSLRRSGERLAVYAGGFTPNRGLDNLIKAAGDTPGLRLALLGWGPLEQELRQVAQGYGDKIVFAGSVEPDLVVATCSRADIGILSYEPIGLNNELAAPNKLYEYLHAGLAIAASSLPEARTLLKDLQIGSTFNAQDPASIRDALATLVNGDIEAMKRRALQAAPAYTWSSQAQILTDLYARLGR